VNLHRHTSVDARLRTAMRADPRITHALAYGSFTQGTADEDNDLEYWLYLASDAEFDVMHPLCSPTPARHRVLHLTVHAAPTGDLPRGAGR
jgi:lincosamide nucleotidyltransferase